MKFVDWLAQRLYTEGTRRAFGVPGGGSSLDLITALRAAGIDTIVTAREDAAIMMAGATGVLSDGPGIAFTTKGPGLASGTNGLAAAALDRMPALLITESFEPGELQYLTHQVYDQAALARPLLEQAGAAQVPPTRAGVNEWLRTALATPCKPGVMFPTSRDLICDETEPLNEQEVPSEQPERPDQSLISQAREQLAAARRPVVIVGLGAARSGTAPPLRDFMRGLRAPALCTYMAKGCVPDNDSNYAGIFTGGAIEQPCVEEADLIVLVGLDPVELIRKPWPYQTPVLELVDVVHQPHYFLPELRLVGPLNWLLEQMTQGLTACEWLPDAVGAHRQRFLQGMAVPTNRNDVGLSSERIVGEAVKTFQSTAKPLPVLTVDAGAHMFSACAFWPCQSPRDLLISNGLATMGFSLPAGIAAALHVPQRGAVAMTGDGGLLMCLGELKTAAEIRANLTTIVFNDGRLSLIDIKRQERQMKELGMSWARPNFAAVARGFGIKAWQARDDSSYAEALSKAAVTQGPTLIDVWGDAAGYPQQLRALRG